MPLKREQVVMNQRAALQQQRAREHFNMVSMAKRNMLAGKRLTNAQKLQMMKALKSKKQSAARAQPSNKNNVFVTLDNYFSAIFVLNMERRLDRWYNMVHRLDRQGVKNYERFIAVDGHQPEIKAEWEEYNAKPFNNYDKMCKRKAIRSPGVLGILYSMRKMIMLAKERGLKRFLVLQDDAMFHHNFVKNFSEQIKLVPQNWKLLFLGATQFSFTKEMTDAKHFYYPLGKADGAFAVAIDSSVYDFIIQQIDRKVMPFDSGPLAEVQKKYPLECIVMKPYLIIADTTESDCRDDFKTEEFAKSVRWDYPRFIEHATLPAAPLVTVIMVTENSANYVEDAVRSLVDQSYTNIELIVVDNASEDNTIDVIKRFKNSIRIHRTDVKMLDSVCYNIGLLLAKGDVVTFQSPEYKSTTTRIAEQVNAIKTNNSVVTVGHQLVNDKVDQCMESAMISKKVLMNVGYFENEPTGWFYEMFEKIKALGYPVKEIREIYYIPYAALTENREVVEDRSRAEEIKVYHEWLLKQEGCKYRPFPPKVTDLDVQHITNVLQNPLV